MIKINKNKLRFLLASTCAFTSLLATNTTLGADLQFKSIGDVNLTSSTNWTIEGAKGRLEASNPPENEDYIYLNNNHTLTIDKDISLRTIRNLANASVNINVFSNASSSTIFAKNLNFNTINKKISMISNNLVSSIDRVVANVTGTLATNSSLRIKAITGDNLILKAKALNVKWTIGDSSNLNNTTNTLSLDTESFNNITLESYTNLILKGVVGDSLALVMNPIVNNLKIDGTSHIKLKELREMTLISAPNFTISDFTLEAVSDVTIDTFKMRTSNIKFSGQNNPTITINNMGYSSIIKEVDATQPGILALARDMQINSLLGEGLEVKFLNPEKQITLQSGGTLALDINNQNSSKLTIKGNTTITGIKNNIDSGNLSIFFQSNGNIINLTLASNSASTIKQIIFSSSYRASVIVKGGNKSEIVDIFRIPIGEEVLSAIIPFLNLEVMDEGTEVTMKSSFDTVKFNNNNQTVNIVPKIIYVEISEDEVLPTIPDVIIRDIKFGNNDSSLILSGSGNIRILKPVFSENNTNGKIIINSDKNVYFLETLGQSDNLLKTKIHIQKGNLEIAKIPYLENNIELGAEGILTLKQPGEYQFLNVQAENISEGNNRLGKVILGGGIEEGNNPLTYVFKSDIGIKDKPINELIINPENTLILAGGKSIYANIEGPGELKILSDESINEIREDESIGMEGGGLMAFFNGTNNTNTEGSGELEILADQSLELSNLHGSLGNTTPLKGITLSGNVNFTGAVMKANRITGTDFKLILKDATAEEILISGEILSEAQLAEESSQNSSNTFTNATIDLGLKKLQINNIKFYGNTNVNLMVDTGANGMIMTNNRENFIQGDKLSFKVWIENFNKEVTFKPFGDQTAITAEDFKEKMDFSSENMRAISFSFDPTTQTVLIKEDLAQGITELENEVKKHEENLSGSNSKTTQTVKHVLTSIIETAKSAQTQTGESTNNNIVTLVNQVPKSTQEVVNFSNGILPSNAAAATNQEPITDMLSQHIVYLNNNIPIENRIQAAGDDSSSLKGFYSQVFYGSAEKENEYKSESKAILAGLDFEASNSTSLGLGFILGLNKIKFKSGGTNNEDLTDVLSAGAVLHGSTEIKNNLILEYGSGISLANINSLEHHPVANKLLKAKANFNIFYYNLWSSLGYKTNVSEFAYLIPKAGLSVRGLIPTGYEQTDAEYTNLNVDIKNGAKFYANGGIYGKYDLIIEDNFSLVPEAYIQADYLMYDKLASKFSYSLAGSNQMFEPKIKDDSNLELKAALFLNLNLNSVTISCGYQLLKLDKYLGHIGTIKINLDF